MNKEEQSGLRLFVYALCEPDGTSIRYIGLSANLWKRLCSHFSNPQSTKVREWINSLRERGLVPSLVVLQECVGVDAGIDAEREQIRKHFAILGDKLLNDAETGKKIRKNRCQITLNGRSQTRAQWARELGITRQALDLRLRAHPVEVALSHGKHETRIRREISPVASFDPGREVVYVEVPDISEGRPISHPERRARRKEMARAKQAGCSLEVIAAEFGVGVATVKNAITEFSYSTRRRKRKENVA